MPYKLKEEREGRMITNTKMTIEEKYYDVCDALNSVSFELEVYKQALDYLDSLVSGICANTNECFNECSSLECDKRRGTWAEFALQKVRKDP